MIGATMEQGSVSKNEYGTVRLDPAPAVDGNGLTRGRRPEWLRVRPADSPKYRELRGLFRGKVKRQRRRRHHRPRNPARENTLLRGKLRRGQCCH